MTLINNPGSRIGTDQQGWTNTEARAIVEAAKWLANAHADGLTDVELLDGCTPDGEGRWRFTFRHKVTGALVYLDTHGIDDTEAYERQHIFAPRVYWNGSSTADPKLDDFAAPGFVPVKTFRPADVPQVGDLDGKAATT